MSQKISLDGKTYRIWFKHAQRDMDPENDKFIDAAIANALDLGQIKKYRRGVLEFDPIVNAATLCTIETDDEKHDVVACGYSFCSENEKRFVKNDSRNRALGRAIQAYWKDRGGKVRIRKG